MVVWIRTYMLYATAKKACGKIKKEQLNCGEERTFELAILAQKHLESFQDSKNVMKFDKNYKP
jgi:hypothetical protein